VTGESAAFWVLARQSDAIRQMTIARIAAGRRQPRRRSRPDESSHEPWSEAGAVPRGAVASGVGIW